ncbi:hypothetical protein RHOFW104T7_00085 [Rhodanobacter thiooxydans]|uniref:Uncharacterized protein n=1 Tax=Rhodanobacter thiooxydans TaxID=416169 RepID=A0A154QE95_9GAMM|nr:hypothetical protein RHOFW104T7_00085 [Rhodanobacter thiooxydans]
MVQRQEAALQLLVPYQQLAETIEPAMRDLYDPAPGPFVRVTLQLSRFLSASFDMGDVAVLLDDHQRRRPGIACVGAQMLASTLERWRTLDHDRLQYGLQLRDIMPIRAGHDDR